MAFPERDSHHLLYPLFTVMPWRVGNGVVFPLHKVVREALHWYPGQLLIARVHVPYLTLRVALPERMIPIDEFGPEVLPPSWPGKEDNATTPDDTADTAPATAKPHARDHRG